MKPGKFAEFTKLAEEIERKRSPLRAGITMGAYGAAGGAAGAGLAEVIHTRNIPSRIFSKGFGRKFKKSMLKGGLIGAGLLGTLGVVETLIRNRKRE